MPTPNLQQDFQELVQVVILGFDVIPLLSQQAIQLERHVERGA